MDSCKLDDNDSYTEAYQKHTDCSYGYKVVCSYDDQCTKPVQYYRGENTNYKFMEKMLDEVKHCKNIIKYKFNKPLKMTDQDKNDLKKVTECHICNKKYDKKGQKSPRLLSCNWKIPWLISKSCDLNLKLTDKIPVIFHNLRGYDSHFIMQ